MELGKTRLSGTTVYYPDGQLNNEITHKFPLFGLSSQYNISDNIHFYGGLSQTYRPVILKDIVPQSIYEITDKNLKDAKGYVIEIPIVVLGKIYVGMFLCLMSNMIINWHFSYD